MIVCIAEKPSVGRDIAHVLGANQQHDGYMEGNGYQVTWTFGHLCELKEPHEYSPMWKTWSLSQLPMIPQRFGIKLKTDKGVEKQFNTIKRLMLGAERIVNCGDAGQEGELIQRWVIQMTGAKCPVQRLWINSLTEEAIREGFQTLKDQTDYQSLYEAGLSRAIGDWTLGMNATRLYTLKYRSMMAQEKQVLSIGRVQTPTLALIVRRQQEIENFVPVPYWVLTTKYRDVVFSAIMEEGDRGYKTREEGEAALATVREQPFTIVKVEKKKGTEAPPRLFDLTSLQVECNRKYGFSADLTLQLIQSLYEKKYTTYPRVDTTFLPDDVYPKCPQIMNGLRNYFHLMERIKGKKLPKSKKVFDNKKVTDHHAIIPTGVYAQAMTETGFLQFGGDVDAAQCNFAGMGATGNGVKGNTFEDVRTGLRAQVQHLKAYASSADLVNELVDPRFAYVRRGMAPYVEWLSIQNNPNGTGWAYDANYAAKLLSMITEVKAM